MKLRTLRSRSSLTSPNLDIWASPISLFTYASDYSGLVGFHLSRFLGAKIML